MSSVDTREMYRRASEAYDCTEELPEELPEELSYSIRERTIEYGELLAGGAPWEA